jgi:hypothetical protein
MYCEEEGATTGIAGKVRKGFIAFLETCDDHPSLRKLRSGAFFWALTVGITTLTKMYRLPAHRQ